MSKDIWFTSDWHLGHKNIVGPDVSKWASGYRDFKTLEEMDHTIMATYNKYVKERDLVYHLGDLCFGSALKWIHYLRQLKPTIMFYVTGNHDHETPYDLEGDWFSSVSQLLEVKIQGTKFVLCHYPMRTWNKSHHGSIHLFGHEHGEMPDYYIGPGPFDYAKAIDVGVDHIYKLKGEWRPIHLDEVFEIMKTRVPTSMGHHNGERE